jgi:hypothetical protein
MGAETPVQFALLWLERLVHGAGTKSSQTPAEQKMETAMALL